MRTLKWTAAGVGLLAAVALSVISTAAATGPRGHTPVTICHKPGTPAQHEITVDDDSIVQAHLAHGDYLGPCQGDPPPPGNPPPPPGPPPPPDCDHSVMGGKDGNPGNDDCVPDVAPPAPSSPPVAPPPAPVLNCPDGYQSAGSMAGVLLCERTITNTRVVTKVKKVTKIKWRTKVKIRKVRVPFFNPDWCEVPPEVAG